MKKLLTIATVAMMAVGAFAATQQDVTLTATVQEGTSELTITPTSIGLGTIAPAAGAFRFHTTEMTADFFPASAAWRIEVYTDQETSTNTPISGLKAVGADFAMPLKMWQANYGPSPLDEAYTNDYALGNPPNANEIRFWKGWDGDGDGTFTNNVDPNGDKVWQTGEDAESIFRWVLDKDDPEAAGYKFYLAGSAGQDSSPVPFYLYVDAFGALATNYSSVITFDLVHY